MVSATEGIFILTEQVKSSFHHIVKTYGKPCLEIFINIYKESQEEFGLTSTAITGIIKDIRCELLCVSLLKGRDWVLSCEELKRETQGWGMG